MNAASLAHGPQLREAGVAGSYSGLRPGCDLSADYQIGRAEGSSWVTVGAIRSTGLTGALGIARRAAAICDEAWRESGAAAETPQPPPLGGGAVRTTPLPPLHEIAASYRARADGSVVFGADEAGFGPHDDPPMSLSEAEAAARGSHAGSRASSPPPPERNGKAPMYQQHPHSGPSSGGSLPPLSEISSAPLLELDLDDAKGDGASSAVTSSAGTAAPDAPDVKVKDYDLHDDAVVAQEAVEKGKVPLEQVHLGGNYISVMGDFTAISTIKY